MSRQISCAMWLRMRLMSICAASRIQLLSLRIPSSASSRFTPSSSMSFMWKFRLLRPLPLVMPPLHFAFMLYVTVGLSGVDSDISPRV